MLLKTTDEQVNIWGQSRKRFVLLVPYDDATYVTGYSEAGLKTALRKIPGQRWKHRSHRQEVTKSLGKSEVFIRRQCPLHLSLFIFKAFKVF